MIQRGRTTAGGAKGHGARMPAWWVGGHAGRALLLLVILASRASAQAGAGATAATAAPRNPIGAARDSAPAALPPIQFKVLFDVDYVSQEPQQQPPNVGFGMRRARLFAQVNGPAGVAFRLHFDPTSLTNGPQSAAPYRGVPLVEAYLDYTLPGHLVVRVGQQRVPFTLNSGTAGPSMPVPEYNQVVRYTVQRVSAFRDIGATISGRTGPLEYSAGIFNGAGINVVSDNDSTKDYAMRVSYALLPGVQLGVSGWTGHTGALFVRNAGAAPLKSFFDNADVHRSGIDLHVARGALDVAAEYGGERVENNAKALNPTPRGVELRRAGYNVTSSLRLGAFSPALRRWEVAGRYDRWDPDRSVDGDRVTEVVAGVSFYLFETTLPTDSRLGRSVSFVQRQSRLMAFWEFDRPETTGVAAPASALLKANTQRFHARWEVFY
jgi:hypothetical protein